MFWNVQRGPWTFVMEKDLILHLNVKKIITYMYNYKTFSFMYKGVYDKYAFKIRI